MGEECVSVWWGETKGSSVPDVGKRLMIHRLLFTWLRLIPKSNSLLLSCSKKTKQKSQRSLCRKTLRPTDPYIGASEAEWLTQRKETDSIAIHLNVFQVKPLAMEQHPPHTVAHKYAHNLLQATLRKSKAYK